MNLDRGLIKSQAKELIKGNVFKLFIIIFVVTLLTEGGTIYSSAANVYKRLSNSFGSSFSDSFDNRQEGDLENSIDEYDFDDFVEGYENSDDMEEFDLDDFANQYEDGNILGGADEKAAVAVSGGLGALSTIAGIAMLFLAPLAITLAGVFYQLIKGNNLSWEDEFSYVFSKTFDKNYWSKFLLDLLKGIFMTLLMFLFIVPGVIFYYKYYFTSFILAEKPELSWKDAMNISKKMTDGHKGELFVLDLSFIGWGFLTAITFGIVGIYVQPYVYTTKALYYENFKIRAFQLGIMSEQDYLTENEKAAMAYGDAANMQAGYYQPSQAQENAFQAPQENTYQPPVQNYQYQQMNNTYQKAENPTSTMDEPMPAQPVTEQPPVAEPMTESAQEPDAEPIVEEPSFEATEE